MHIWPSNFIWEVQHTEYDGVYINATHVTLNESDASDSITWLHFKLLNAHFSKTNGCFG